MSHDHDEKDAKGEREFIAWADSQDLYSVSLMPLDEQAWHAVRAETARMVADAERYRYWRAGHAVTVLVPTMRDGKPKPITVMLAPNPQPEWGDALDAALDALRVRSTQPDAGEKS